MGEEGIEVCICFNSCVALLLWNRAVGDSGRSRCKRCPPTYSFCRLDCNPSRDTRTALAPRLAPRLPGSNWALLVFCCFVGCCCIDLPNNRYHCRRRIEIAYLLRLQLNPSRYFWAHRYP